MANTNIMDVEIKALTKYGFQDGTGAYVGWSKNFKEADKGQVVPGRKFSVEMYIADSGKQYVNKILRALEASVTPPIVAPVFAKTPTAKPLAKAPVSETMTKADWNNKDRSQLIGGLSHDSATLVAAMLAMRPIENTSEVITLFSEVLNGLLQVRDSLK